MFFIKYFWIFINVNLPTFKKEKKFRLEKIIFLPKKSIYFLTYRNEHPVSSLKETDIYSKNISILNISSYTYYLVIKTCFEMLNSSLRTRKSWRYKSQLLKIALMLDYWFILLLKSKYKGRWYLTIYLGSAGDLHPDLVKLHIQLLKKLKLQKFAVYEKTWLKALGI